MELDAFAEAEAEFGHNAKTVVLEMDHPIEPLRRELVTQIQREIGHPKTLGGVWGGSLGALRLRFQRWWRKRRRRLPKGTKTDEG